MEKFWYSFVRSFHGGGEFMRAEEEAGAERGIGGEVRRMRAWYCRAGDWG